MPTDTLASRPLGLPSVLAGTLGFLLLGLNLYGEARGMRVAESVPAGELRFEADVSLTREEALAALQPLDGETDRDYAIRAMGIVQRSMAHLRRWHGHPPDLWNQRVPLAENLYLHLVGRWSGLLQFERYHFADYKRSLERGIGVCGDHTLILSQVLDLAGIDNALLSFQGHVLAEARFDGGDTMLLDPDFGVAVQADADRLERDPSIVSRAYGDAGYSEREIGTLQDTFALGHVRFDDAYSFMRLRWWFEHVSYAAKWAVPLTLIALLLPIAASHRRRAAGTERAAPVDCGSALTTRRSSDREPSERRGRPPGSRASSGSCSPEHAGIAATSARTSRCADQRSGEPVRSVPHQSRQSDEVS